MMIDPQVHLTDEELLALRDGLYLDKRLLEHVEHCDYCQAVLSEWRRFHEVLVRSDPQAMEPGAGHYFSLAMADDAEITRADLHEDLLSEASPPLDHRPEEEWRKADAPRPPCWKRYRRTWARDRTAFRRRIAPRPR